MPQSCRFARNLVFLLRFDTPRLQAVAQYASKERLSPAVSAVALVQAQVSSLNTMSATVATLTAGGGRSKY